MNCRITPVASDRDVPIKHKEKPKSKGNVRYGNLKRLLGIIE